MNDETIVGFEEPTIGRAEALAELLRAGLLDQAQLAEVDRAFAPGPLPLRLLGRFLLDRRWLTPFQANRFLQGRTNEVSLGNWLLLDLLGEGGMGQVYRARHKLTGQLRALKLIRAGKASTEAMRRFKREIEAVSRLSHPNVVAAHDAAQEGATLFLVLELVKQHAHEHGLVHRNVKPSNLIVTPAGAVKLLDLGLPRIEEDDAWTLTDSPDSTHGLCAWGERAALLDAASGAFLLRKTVAILRVGK